MPSWGEIVAEINATPGNEQAGPLDIVRRKYLAALHAHTGRPVILYASRWVQGVPPRFRARGLIREGERSPPGGKGVGKADGVLRRLHLDADESRALFFGFDDAGGFAVDVEQASGSRASY